MTIRTLTLMGACLTLAACASQPEPVAMPQSMSLPPASLSSGQSTAPAVSSSATGSMGAYTPPAGSGSLSRSTPDPATNSMAVPDSSMGNLRRPPRSRATP